MQGKYERFGGNIGMIFIDMNWLMENILAFVDLLKGVILCYHKKT